MITRDEVKRLMNEETLSADQATEAVNDNIITACEMFNYFEYGDIIK